MKSQQLPPLFITLALATSSVPAASLYWDAVPGTADGTSQGGAGTWDTATANWDDGAAYQTWDNTANAGDTAVFAGSAGAVAIDAGGVTAGALDVTGGYTFSGGAITAAGGLVKSGSGTLTITNNNSITGDLVINSGDVQLGTNNNTGSLNGGSYAGNISIASGSTFRDRSNNSVTMSGVISGEGNLHQDGGGTMTLTGDNTYTGRTIIAASGAGGPSLSVSSLNSVNGGTPLMASSSLGAPTTEANGKIQLGSGTNVRSCSLIYTGAGETTDRVMDVRFNSSAKHTIRNDGGGLLRFTSDFEITPSSGSTSGGLYLRGSGDGEAAQIGTLPGFLQKLDAGTWTVGGTNAANAVTVSAGSLIIEGGFTVTTVLNVANGATLSPGYTNTQTLTLGAASNVTMELGGTTLGTGYDNITLAAAGAVTYGGNLNVLNLGPYDMDAASFVYNLFELAGATPSGDFASVTVNSVSLTNGGGTWTGSNGEADYSFDQSTGDLSITVIPEPSLFLLGAFGLIGLLRRRRR